MSDNQTPITFWSVLFTSGSIAGYASLIWQFWITRVHVAVRAEYLDNFAEGLRFRVSNRGNRTTTLTRIEVKVNLDSTHNIGASPDIGGIELPVKLAPGEHWEKAIFTGDAPGDDDEEEEARRKERIHHRFKWLKDEAIIERAAVLMYFSHRTRPIRIRISPDADMRLGPFEMIALWWHSRRS